MNVPLFKFNNRKTRERCAIFSKLTIKTPELLQWHRSDVFFVNLHHISHLFSNVSIVDFEQANVSWVKFRSFKFLACSNFVAREAKGLVAIFTDIYDWVFSCDFYWHLWLSIKIQKIKWVFCLLKCSIKV